MSTAVDHPLSRRLHDAALGSFPAEDRSVEVGPALPGPCDAVLFFAGHVVVAADVDEAWVLDAFGPQLAREPNDPSTGLGIFLGALAQRLGGPPTYASVLTVAQHKAAYLPGKLERGGELHPGWADYRTDVEAYRYASTSASGTVGIGRGPGGRRDVYLAVDGGGARAGKELLAAARTLVPSDEALFGSARIDDARSLRAGLASGFEPICAEVLFLTRPGG